MIKMPRKCSVFGCPNGQGTKGITTYRFPKDPHLRDAWTLYLKREGFCPNDTSVVCTVVHILRPRTFKLGTNPEKIE